MYHPDTHYSTDHLSQAEKAALLQAAKAKAYEWWVDKLDCSQSLARQPTDMSFEQVMKLFDENSFLVVIHRRGAIGNGPNLEVGFSSMRKVEYFLFMHLPTACVSDFVDNYKLMQL